MRITAQFLFPTLVCMIAMSGVSLGQSNPPKTRVILDTDANNELDDQHAIAYLLFNGDVFDVEGITVNRTQTGGGVDQHLAEAQRVVRLCGLDSKIPVLRGADKSFDEIKGRLDRPDFDGAEAVNFIIDRAKAADSRRLVLLPVGKLTNIALALAKEPSIVPRVRIVWLGSNYPDPGEYNQVNDEPSLNYILDTGVAFEIALVRYGKPSGTDAVRATLPEIRRIMPGKGPQVSPPVTGRHGGQFTCFGDYSISLFENIKLYGDPPSRALFDMAAVAIVKNPAWATAVTIPAPILKDGRWMDRPDNQRKIILWEDFDRKAIMADFYDRMTNYQLAGGSRATADNAQRIRPWSQNPRYWQYKGKPVLLLGGSKDDNLFQIPDLKEHLDEMVAAGANYIRNTMSDRPDYGFEVHPFGRRPDGNFDLERWNDEYWTRFENMLRWTAERDIIVQIELWDMWDMHADGWKRSLWNPANNVNYTYDNTRLAAAYSAPTYRDGTSQGKPHDFFLTVPALNHDRIVLSYQQRFVDKVLSYSLRCDHVLYCISNEVHPQYPPQWGWYWADYLRKQASAAGRGIEVAEMYWTPDLKAEQHRASLDHPEIYSFFEASQNSAVLDPEENWRNLQFVYQRLSPHPRPINNTKIYGAETAGAWTGTTQNAQEKFWRNIFGGSAASRFHRPPSGLGLSEPARVHIRSLRMLTDAMNVFACAPHNELLSERSANEAYCLGEPGKQYAVYFPNGGSVKLDVSAAQGSLQVRWLDVGRNAWQRSQVVAGKEILELEAPGKGHWVALSLAK